MVLVQFEKDHELNILKVKSWQYITTKAALKIKNLEGQRIKFNDSDIPTNFYKYATEYFLDNNRLRRYYIKKKAV